MSRAGAPRSLRERDATLSERVHLRARASRYWRRAATLVAHSGDGWWCLIAVALLLASGPPRRVIAVAILAGFLLTALVVRVIKVTVRRERPNGDWEARQRRMDPHAFPSGHAARAAMLAVVVSATAASPALAAALVLWALAVATARVAVGVHYLSDVVAGIAVGVACGLATLVALAA